MTEKKFPVMLRTYRSAWLEVRGWSLGLGITVLSMDQSYLCYLCP